MSKWPGKCVIDTNVPISANLATKADANTEFPMACVLNCIECIEHVTTKGCLVLDDGGDIVGEYLSQNMLSLKGAPGIGDKFIKWVNDHQWNPSRVSRVRINKNGESYDEFPEHEDLKRFDISDRKFVAVANAHPEKPPIFQATDSKWWGWKDGLLEKGVTVCFLCPDYVKAKYAEKMGR